MLSSSARRALTLTAGLLALLAIVAVAARGHVAGAGSGPTRSVPGDLVLEYLLLLFGVGAVLLVPLLVVVFSRAREEPDALPNRGNWMLRLFVAMTLLALVAASRLLFRLFQHHHAHGGSPTNPAAKLLQHIPQAPPAQSTARFDWAPVIVVLSVAAVGLVAGYLLFLRARGERRPRPALTALELSQALDESLDDLRGEQDARRAVIAAYARLERVLAASGLPRHAAEAPLEYLGRVLRDLLRASASSVSLLTNLFERAKFSQHAIGPDLKEEAIEALVAVRDELRAYS
jgi:hypothetical protein